MQQSEKQSCSPSLSLSLSSLVRRVWSFITLPSSPSAAVFSSSLQNAERASSERRPRASRRSVGRSVVQPGLHSGAIVLLLARSREGRKNSSWSFLALSSPLLFSPFERPTDCDRPCVHVRSCPTVGQSQSVGPLRASGAVMSRGLYIRLGSPPQQNVCAWDKCPSHHSQYPKLGSHHSDTVISWISK